MVGRVELPVYRTLQTVVDHGVATITLNRPQQRNAVGDEMREELADAYLRCDRAAVGARETAIHLALMRHDDAREGVRAFTERRPPRWTGRPVEPTRPGSDGP